MTKQATLADHDDYLITLHRAEKPTSDRLIITFGGLPTDKTPKGFGTGFALRHGWDTIYVAQRYTTQYQGLDAAAFLEAVHSVASGRDVVTYGSSLGGYAALYFGGILNARILAVAPMLKPWRPLGLKAYHNVEIRHSDLWDAPLSRHRPTVIYDSMLREDTIMIEQMVLRAYPDARLVSYEHCGHAALIPIARTGKLSEYIHRIIDKDEVPEISLPTDDCPVWNFERGMWLKSRNKAEARVHFEKSLALQPSRRTIAQLMVVLLRLGDRDAAQRLVNASASSQDPGMVISPDILKMAAQEGVKVH